MTTERPSLVLLKYSRRCRPCATAGRVAASCAHNDHKLGAGELGVLTVPAVPGGEQNDPIVLARETLSRTGCVVAQAFVSTESTEELVCVLPVCPERVRPSLSCSPWAG